MEDKFTRNKDLPCRKSPWRFAFLAVSILAGLWLCFTKVLGWILLLLPQNSVAWSASEAASVGIIGGADGPTAIFIATAVSRGIDWELILVLSLFIGGLVGYLRLRKCSQKP